MPVTCGRTSATLNAVVRPGSWSVISTERGLSVTTLTSAGGGGPLLSAPQAASTSAAPRPMKRLFLAGIARSIGQHAGQKIIELRQLVFLEAIEMHVHALDHDGPDAIGHLAALRGEMQ